MSTLSESPEPPSLKYRDHQRRFSLFGGPIKLLGLRAVPPLGDVRAGIA
jgi:hypothetical protein